MTFILGLMPWWGWILVVLAGIGLAMFPAQALLIARRVPLPVWGALLALLILFGAYRVGYKSAENDCKEANRKAHEAADKEAKAQEEAAPVIAQEAIEAVQPKIEERIRYVEKYNTVSCDEPYADGVQSEIHQAEASANRL